MKNKRKYKSKYVLLFFVVICLFMIMFSAIGKKYNNIYRFFGKLIVPVEKAISKTEYFLVDKFSFFRDKEEILAENQALTIKNQELSSQIASLELEISMLNEYRDLYNLDKSYEEYHKIEANVIANDGSNWFSSLTIDVGADDGIKEGMNVISGNGLVGKVVSVGDNWSNVRTIIDSSSYVAVMASNTGDYGILKGSLEMSKEGCANIEQFYDSDNNTRVGDMLVTSNVSDVYWPGILVGYISELDTDSNNLTKNGIVNLAADFEHLRTVFVITDMKEEK